MKQIFLSFLLESWVLGSCTGSHSWHPIMKLPQTLRIFLWRQSGRWDLGDVSSSSAEVLLCPPWGRLEWLTPRNFSGRTGQEAGVLASSLTTHTQCTSACHPHYLPPSEHITGWRSQALATLKPVSTMLRMKNIKLNREWFLHLKSSQRNGHIRVIKAPWERQLAIQLARQNLEKRLPDKEDADWVSAIKIPRFQRHEYCSLNS